MLRVEATHRHVRHAEAVEHVVVRILELREVDVLFKGLVLGAQLRETAHGVHRVVKSGRGQAMRELLGR